MWCEPSLRTTLGLEVGGGNRTINCAGCQFSINTACCFTARNGPRGSVSLTVSYAIFDRGTFLKTYWVISTQHIWLVQCRLQFPGPLHLQVCAQCRKGPSRFLCDNSHVADGMNCKRQGEFSAAESKKLSDGLGCTLNDIFLHNLLILLTTIPTIHHRTRDLQFVGHASRNRSKGT